MLIIPNKKKNNRVVVKKGWKTKDKIALVTYNPKTKRVSVKDGSGKLIYTVSKGWYSPVFALAAVDLPDQVKAMAMLELYRQDLQS